MIGISKLYCMKSEASDKLRYHHGATSHASRKPIVVWNCTHACNQNCSHCYAHSTISQNNDELTSKEAKLLIDELACFGCPVLLFSGGEPLIRHDILELIEYATSKGLHAVLSTNGTLIDTPMARTLKSIKLTYVGISIDGLEQTHDRFRNQNGAFQKALMGIQACQKAGLKVGLRYTINKSNLAEIPAIFDFVIREKIPRICFYHLVCTGRGQTIKQAMLSHKETRQAIDTIIDHTEKIHAEKHNIEVLTVANLADGPYLYLRMLKEKHPAADRTFKLLQQTGGGSTGVGIVSINWNGDVYLDQFWRQHPVGNIRKRTFGDIWTDLSNPLMAKIKEKAKHVKGRCQTCRFLSLCCGNFRARAEALTGNMWASDPACYLTDSEIHLTDNMIKERLDVP